MVRQYARCWKAQAEECTMAGTRMPRWEPRVERRLYTSPLVAFWEIIVCNLTLGACCLTGQRSCSASMPIIVLMFPFHFFFPSRAVLESTHFILIITPLEVLSHLVTEGVKWSVQSIVSHFGASSTSANRRKETLLQVLSTLAHIMCRKYVHTYKHFAINNNNKKDFLQKLSFWG